MNHRSRCRRWCTLLLCLLLAWGPLSVAGYARGYIDVDRPAELTIQYPCEGVPFHIYRVASVSRYGEFGLTAQFKKYPVTLDQPDQAGWRALATALAAYAALDGIEPTASGVTDRYGLLTFSGLQTGLYLVVGEKTVKDGEIYTPEPFLICLPNLDANDEWYYDVAVRPKYESTPEETEDVRVLKIWDDQGNADARPKQVIVQLLRDGEVWETVILSAGNNWRFEWNDLDTKYSWQIVEVGVETGYTVILDHEGPTYVMVNTYHDEEIPDEPIPEGPGDGPNEEDLPDEPVPLGPGLPQTGMLWWPVPLMACCGMGLFMAGWAIRRRDGEDDET